MEIPDHLTCLLRNRYEGQKQQLEPDMEPRTGSKLGRERSTGRMFVVTLFIYLYAEYCLWNAQLDRAQTGIKIAVENISHLRYVDDSTFMAESEEELKSPLMRMKKESEQAGLNSTVNKTSKDYGIWLQLLPLSYISHVRLLATPWTAAHQAPPSMGISRKEYWSGLPFPSLLPGK